MALTLENMEMEDGEVTRVRKGRNVAHVLRAVPVMLGDYDLTGACGIRVGPSGDASIETGVSLSGKTCRKCDKIISALLAESDATDAREESAAEPVADPSEGERAELIKRGRERRTVRKNGTDTREDSASVTGPTGLSREHMRETYAAWLLKGNAVPAEVATLPDPTTVRATWNGTNGADDAEYRKCEFKGDVEIVNPERTHGKCPECRAYIALSNTKADDDFRIGTHYEYGVTPPVLPAGKRLTSRALETVDHGSTPGDPGTADKRRVGESRCGDSNKIARNAEGKPLRTGGTYTCDHIITEGGTVCGRKVELRKSVRQGKKGPVVRWIIPNHVDARDAFRRAGEIGTTERKVTPRGSGADAGKGQRDHGSVDGSANTGRQNMAPVRPTGWLGVAGTMSLPAMVRPGVDPEVTGKVCPLEECGGQTVEIAHKGMTKNQRRAHSRRLAAWHRIEDAKREIKRNADIAAGLTIPAKMRRRLRKEVSIGSRAEGTQAATGVIVHNGTNADE